MPCERSWTIRWVEREVSMTRRRSERRCRQLLMELSDPKVRSPRWFELEREKRHELVGMLAQLLAESAAEEREKGND